MAQTYFTRASLLIHLSEDKATLLAYKLCQVSSTVISSHTESADSVGLGSQARLFDFSRRFNEAASKYHELSFVAEIDEEERVFML